MRFNTKVGIYKLGKVNDGTGGYTDTNILVKEIYVNSSYLSAKYCLEVFGNTSTTVVTIIFRDNIEFDKKEKYKIKINGSYYNILDIRPIKNKTKMHLEVIDNEN